MSNCRIYGKSPYKVALLHGGPGAAGTLKELAQMLSNDRGILEPLQTKDSLAGQVEELRETLDQHADLPVTLIGHSWGAMLGFIFTATHPTYVNKLIMVGSGLFDSKYVKNIIETRISRLSEDKQTQLKKLEATFKENNNVSDELFYQFGKLMEEVDSFDPIKLSDNEVMKGQYHIYKSVWPEAAKMRERGELLALGKKIKCPVVAIHGNFDPHTYQGIQEPLSTVINNFTFILLYKCGHEPWIERYAKDQFMNLISVHLQEIK
jgi:pimeloyl-ACP methyl ester carboxylesterase